MSVIRVDSAEEQYAHLVAEFGPPTQWTVESQIWVSGAGGEMIEQNALTLTNGQRVEVQFGAVRDEDIEESTESSVEWLDKVLEAATRFSSENPPHHPGTVARFPIPAAGYANAISVPMNVIATDGHSAGLYAPPRIVALDRESLSAIGVGEFPGFDPENWPPARLADWPLVQGLDPEQIQANIHRFSATWSRVLAAWFGDEYPWLQDDARAALDLRSRLDTPAMNAYYDQMNPVFAAWLGRLVQE